MLNLALFVYSIYDMFRLVPYNHQGIRVQHGVLLLLHICYNAYVNTVIPRLASDPANEFFG